MRKLASKKSDNVNPYNAHIAKLLRESLKLLVIASAVFQYVALISYSKLDAGWSKTSLEASVDNLAGYAGAWFADFFLYCFGYLAFIFPGLLLVAVFQSLRSSNEEKKIDQQSIAVKFLGLMLLVFSSSAIISLSFLGTSEYLPFSSGGILGDFIGFGTMEFFNFVGSLVILSAFALVGVSLLSNISWFEIAGRAVELSKLLVRQCMKQCLLAKKYIQEYINSRQLKKEEKPKAISKIIKPVPEEAKKEKINKIIPFIKEKVKAPVAPAKITDNLIKAPEFDNKGKPLPSLSLLDQKSANCRVEINEELLEAVSRDVEQKIADFGIKVDVVGVQPGPVVTRFELELAPGIKASRITTLAKDLARSLSVSSVRVVEVIPGKSYVGLEIPNQDRETVLLSEVLESQQYNKSKAALSLAIGKDISGYPVIVDLAKMPHLLVAGTTGSGKSVGINTMLISLLYKSSPEDVRLILVDPKMLELSVYEDIPHLLSPVVTDMKDAANALRWCVAEMERRYSLMAQLGVRNIAGYNEKITKKDVPKDSEEHMQKLPHIVIVIDEFADMIMVVGKKVEQLIARIAQKARAAGIHMILATQRPSVDVITGLIKSNIPTRIAYQVSSRIDSRTILDQQGAEQLLGHGDMLYLPPGMGTPIRVHGAFVADHEVHKVTDALKKKGKPQYIDAIVDGAAAMGESVDSEQDDLYMDAVNFITETKKVSVSSIQRKFRIGYNRAASIVDAMEAAGVVSAMESNGSREVLI